MPYYMLFGCDEVLPMEYQETKKDFEMTLFQTRESRKMK